MEKTNELKRQYNMDNIKCVLMFLVVFGHCLETFKDYDGLYKMIYIFHMPAFIFISGYFMKFSVKRIITNYVYPYFVFQILYLVFDFLCISGDSFKLQFYKPYWILWYFMAMILYCILSKIIDVKNNVVKIFIFLIAVSAMLLSGYYQSIGTFLSLSRFLNFMPFFVIGFYGAKSNLFNKICKNTYVKFFSLFFSILILVYMFVNKEITRYMLYGSYSYESGHYGPLLRFEFMVMAFVIIAALLTSFKNKEIPVISYLGRNTITVYVLHGFIVKFIEKYNLLNFGNTVNVLLSVLISIVIMLTLGNGYVNRFFSCITSGKWIFRKEV